MQYMTTLWDSAPGGAVPVFELSDRTRKAREYAGLDQGELAERLGVARSTVARMEQGKTERAKRPLLAAWSLATGVSLQWLETGEAPSPDGDGASVVRHQGLEPRTRWFEASAGQDAAVIEFRRAS